MSVDIPLTDEELAAIRKLMLMTGALMSYEPVTDPVKLALRRLLSEVERLRARDAELLEIARAVYELDPASEDERGYNHCLWCGQDDETPDGSLTHTPECASVCAAALLGIRWDNGEPLK